MRTPVSGTYRSTSIPLTSSISASYDIAVVGAGPVGSLCALAHAQQGKQVALLEGNPKASSRLAGEWLHPPALESLRKCGISLDATPQSSLGKGFVVYPDDGSESVLLPYPDGTTGMACEHETLVSELHTAIKACENVDFRRHARVREVKDGLVRFSHDREECSIAANRIVGADGRASVVRKSLGLMQKRLTCSRMVGFALEGVDLPHEGYGHVVFGGAGPIMMFQLGEQRVRVIIDVPVSHWAAAERFRLLSETYVQLLPESLQDAFLDALEAGRFQGAANELRPRASYGTTSRVLIGDAAGHYHPMTAVGLTLGFGDALALAESSSFEEFTQKRLKAIRAPELLATALYEMFVDKRPEAAALRKSTYKQWRSSSKFRTRTMALLGCQDTSSVRLGYVFFSLAVRVVIRTLPASVRWKAWQSALDLVRPLVVRTGYFLRGAWLLRRSQGSASDRQKQARDEWSHALLTSMPASDEKIS